MDSILLHDYLSLTRFRAAAAAATTTTTSSCALQFPCLLTSRPRCRLLSVFGNSFDRVSALRRSTAVSANGTLTANSASPSSGVYTVGDFMTRKEDLHVVKPTTTVDEALEILVERRITGFPVIDDDWKLRKLQVLAAQGDFGWGFCKGSVASDQENNTGFNVFIVVVGLVSDYDLLALDSISGGGRAENSMFPEVDSTWKTFNEVQKLLSKTNGKVVGDLMTPAPVVVRETTNLEDAARLLLETKYRRLPVVDADGKLVGIITRGNVVRAALQIKHSIEREAQ
ncbi:CBS domain-containing protein CBSX1, chloroplastic [Melia azedarach]|uniref:CBS domain-containing protein CBSX1, chloroplastic n=1 Tax=Melia azedarach TaxID=155640 RepID=A0ACC1XTP9_MELAZ|nr:CBS domain-containing protein CBSX1, chloroplastic [Melia azedarach]